jgi:peptidoglycan/xylan/chitin deacetylase (PgdA/CDA1 family)
MATVTNVCFHGIGDPDREMEPGEASYWVTPDSFLRVLDEFVDRPGIRISFDDGNASDVEIGLPALQERGLSATFFVLAGRLEHRGSLALDQVHELVAAGMRVGSHGMHHRSWRGMSAGDSRVELVEAREVLSEVAGQAVTEAALPLGSYDRRLLADLRRQGYQRIYTSDRVQTSESAWLQPRFSVTATDTVPSVHSTMLERPSLVHRAERRALRTVKSLR